MKTNALFSLIAALCGSLSVYAQAGDNAVNPQVAEIVSKVSTERIAATLEKLGSFGTRNVMSSQDDPEHGVGAARRWIADQFRSYSPRLVVNFDEHGIRAKRHLFRDTKIYNVVAVLPGTAEPERHVIVSGHYDTINLLFKNDENGKRILDGPAIAAASAPGVTDDGSGTAAVLELARVMSQYQFRKTIIFIAFAAEEYGLYGSATYAEAARKRGDVIEAVFNNDIIGSTVRGDGSAGNRRINIFSEDPDDSASRQLARYIREAAALYVPEMDTNLVFRHDRFGRGGDHSPFNAYGYAAVRFTTPWENFSNQHTATDTFANTDPKFTSCVTKVNGAAVAALANAPATPVAIPAVLRPGQSIGSPLSRGASGYDAEIAWDVSKAEPDLAGYAVVLRDTKSPYWEREIFVGKVGRYTLPGVSVDEVALGVRAVDKNGNKSLVAPYVNPPYKLPQIETF